MNCQNTRGALGVSSILEWTHCTSLLRTQPSWTEFPILKMGTELCNAFNHCPREIPAPGFCHCPTDTHTGDRWVHWEKLPGDASTGGQTSAHGKWKGTHQNNSSSYFSAAFLPGSSHQNIYRAASVFTVKCSNKSGFMWLGFSFMGDYKLLYSTFYKVQFFYHLQAG